MTHISAYGLLKSNSYAAVDHDIQHFAAFSLQRFAAYLLLAGFQVPTQIQKLQAHTSHLLDLFIKLRERYALLDPMIFDKPIVDKYGAKERSYGFRILRDSLFLSCAQEIAKICFDGDDRAPSIKSLVKTLDNEELRNQLRSAFSDWKYPKPNENQSPEVIAAIERMELREKDQRMGQFDELIGELNTHWAGLAESKSMGAYRTIRDKITAHSEVRYVADEYRFVDIGELGLKWDDMKQILPKMQRVVEILGLVVRNAGFAWQLLDEQLSSAATEFWVVSEGAR